MLTFQSILEMEKERFLSAVSQCQVMEQATREAQNQLDRMLYRFQEEEDNQAITSTVSRLISVAKNGCAFMDAYGETKIFSRVQVSGETEKKGKRSRWYGFFLFFGLLFSIAALAYGAYLLWNDTRYYGPYPLLAAGILGILFLFIAGLFSKRKEQPSQQELIAEAKPDGQKIYRALLSVALMLDKTVDDLRQEQQVEQRKHLKETKANLEKTEVELLAQLLELAYSDLEQEENRQIVSQIKFYLHNRGIEVVNRDETNGEWFDQLPSSDAATLRPALLMDVAPLKKGLATGGSNG